MANRHTQHIETKPEQAFCASFLWTALLLSHLPRFTRLRNPVAAAKAWLRRKMADHLISSVVVDAYPTPTMTRPILTYRRNDPEPNFESLAYKIEKRWARSSRPTRVYWPTSRFARIHGSWAGCDQLLRPHTAGHDLAISAVWLAYLHHDPTLALSCWTSERQLQRKRCLGELKGVPDALVKMKREFAAVEVAGRYPAAWLRHHALLCHDVGWTLVIW